jgi:hypothetical protein
VCLTFDFKTTVMSQKSSFDYQIEGYYENKITPTPPLLRCLQRPSSTVKEPRCGSTRTVIQATPSLRSRCFPSPTPLPSDCHCPSASRP